MYGTVKCYSVIVVAQAVGDGVFYRAFMATVWARLPIRPTSNVARLTVVAGVPATALQTTWSNRPFGQGEGRDDPERVQRRQSASRLSAISRRRISLAYSRSEQGADGGSLVASLAAAYWRQPKVSSRKPPKRSSTSTSIVDMLPALPASHRDHERRNEARIKYAAQNKANARKRLRSPCKSGPAWTSYVSTQPV